MDRAKSLLTLAPLVALGLATTFLQGYWGSFEILPFPYLTLQELLAYSAVPFFGFVFFFLVGWATRAVEDASPPTHRRSRWVGALVVVLFVTYCGALLYTGLPEQWLYIPLLVAGLTFSSLRRTRAFKDAHAADPTAVLAASFMLFALVGSYGYGRMSAERLIQSGKPNAVLTIESSTDPVRLVGKLGTYYFFLDQADRLNVAPEQSVKRITYMREHRGDTLGQLYLRFGASKGL
jgi:hypothetical protein